MEKCDAGIYIPSLLDDELNDDQDEVNNIKIENEEDIVDGIEIENEDHIVEDNNIETKKILEDEKEKIDRLKPR